MFRIGILSNKKLTFVFRVILGLTFLVFGAGKLADLGGFSDTVISYQVLPVDLAKIYAVALPCTEVIIGILLVIGLGLKFVAPVTILVINSIIAGTIRIIYITETTVRTCGCMPGLDWELGIGHIIAQVVMLIMAMQIWLHKGEFLSLDSRLTNINRSG